MAPKKGGKKGKGSSKKLKDKPAAPDGIAYVDHTQYIRPPTPPPRLTELPSEVKNAAMVGDVLRVHQWLTTDHGHVDATWHNRRSRLPLMGQGWTTLHAAAASGAEDVVSYLLDNEASLDLQDDKGETALMLAGKARMCGYGHHDKTDRIVLQLIKAGASLTISNYSGATAAAMINPVFLGGHVWPGTLAKQPPLEHPLLLRQVRPQSAVPLGLIAKPKDPSKLLHTAQRSELQRYLERGTR